MSVLYILTPVARLGVNMVLVDTFLKPVALQGAQMHRPNFGENSWTKILVLCGSGSSLRSIGPGWSQLCVKIWPWAIAGLCWQTNDTITISSTLEQTSLKSFCLRYYTRTEWLFIKNLVFKNDIRQIPPIYWIHNDSMYVWFGGIRNIKTGSKSDFGEKSKN